MTSITCQNAGVLFAIGAKVPEVGIQNNHPWPLAGKSIELLHNLRMS